MIYDLDLKKLTYSNKEMWSIVGFAQDLDSRDQEFIQHQRLIDEIAKYTKNEGIKEGRDEKRQGSNRGLIPSKKIIQSELQSNMNLWSFIVKRDKADE